MFGLNADIRRITERLATLGYVALAPDLYDGRGRRLLCIARTMRDLRSGQGRTFDDLEAARAWLCQRPDVDASRIGVIGFCMGGGFSLLFAARAPVNAAAVFYGAVPGDASSIEGVCPVVGGYGARDRMFSGQGKRLRSYLDEQGIENDVRFYDDAGHSFMNRHSGLTSRVMSWGPLKVGYNEQAAEDSWKRIEAFFGRHLG
jgi:carboxymethylenebutenolidase